MTESNKLDRSSSFHIKRRSLSTEEISRRTFQKPETVIGKMSLNEKRKNRMLMQTTHSQPFGYRSNLMQRSQLPTSSKRNEGRDRRQRAFSSMSDISRDKRLTNLQLKPNLISNLQLLKRELPKRTEHESTNGQTFFRKRSHQIDRVHRTLRSNKPANTTIAQFNRQRKTGEQNPFPSAVEMREVRSIGGEQFIVSLRLDSDGLLVRADLKDYLFGEPKVIRLTRENSLYFLKKYCNNQLERICDRLHYDGMYLYLLADKPQ